MMLDGGGGGKRAVLAAQHGGFGDCPCCTPTAAGYPDTKPNGSMWYDACRARQWDYALHGGRLLWHGCSGGGGFSGSALWVRWRNASGGWRRQVVGMHVAAVKVRGASASGAGGQEDRPLAVVLGGELGRWVRSSVARHAC